MTEIQLTNEVSKKEAENNEPSSSSSTTENLPPPQPITGFLVNKGTVPLDKETWNSMLERVKLTHPQGEKIIDDLNSKELDFIRVTRETSPPSANDDKQEKTSTEQEPNNFDKYGDISIAVEPKFSPLTSDLQKIAAVQRYLNRLQYNHTGMQFFNIKKSRSITRLYDTAKEMIKYSLPIKCLIISLRKYENSFNEFHLQVLHKANNHEQAINYEWPTNCANIVNGSNLEITCI